jgi:hypothetical protein
MVRLCWLRLVRAGRASSLVYHRITEMADPYSATYAAVMKCLLADSEGLTA